MKKFITKIMYVLSFICLHNVSAMESLPGLELRNGSKFPATVTIYYDIQGIKEEMPASFKPVTVALAPISSDGTQDQKKIPNPKRYGLVSVEFDGGIKFHNVVDLISQISVGSTGTVFHSFNHYNSPTANIAPEWLLKSLTFKKFDLRGYGYNLSKKWESLHEEQKKTPYMYDIPSCMHAVTITPQMTTPFPLCLSEGMKSEVLANYIKTHPEINVTEEEIVKLEEELRAKGIPLIEHK